MRRVIKPAAPTSEPAATPGRPELRRRALKYFKSWRPHVGAHEIPSWFADGAEWGYAAARARIVELEAGWGAASERVVAATDRAIDAEHALTAARARIVELEEERERITRMYNELRASRGAVVKANIKGAALFATERAARQAAETRLEALCKAVEVAKVVHDGRKFYASIVAEDWQAVLAARAAAQPKVKP